jgi:tRNA pseudouridine38-40 synthase
MQLSNFKMTIEYDGSGFHGWQRQKGCRTVQEEIEIALNTLIRQKIAVIGSGRTDAGVHALGQVASFKCHTRLDPGTIQKALNSLLPECHRHSRLPPGRTDVSRPLRCQA